MKQPNSHLISSRLIPRLNRWLKPFGIGALGLNLLACCPTEPSAPDSPIPGHLLAQNLGEIRVLHIAGQDCAEVLRHNLPGHGYPLSDGREAGANLIVQLSQQHPLRESLPLIKTLGQQASYRADLLGREGQPLLSIYGQEGSLSLTELCDDIGDEIANKLDAYLP